MLTRPTELTSRRGAPSAEPDADQKAVGMADWPAGGRTPERDGARPSRAKGAEGAEGIAEAALGCMCGTGASAPTPVVRRALLTAITQALATTSIVTLEAPAGYGKTTTLRQLRASLPRSTMLTPILVSLSLADQRPEAFLSTLDAALASCGRAQRPATPIPRERPLTPAAAASAAAALMARLDGASVGHVVMFDELHRALTPEIEALLADMIARAPPHVRFVLAARREPASVTAHLRVSRALAEFRAPDLALTREEVSAVFSPPLADSLLDMVMARTEGWPAALALLQDALADHAPRSPAASPAHIRAFSGAGREMYHYLDQEWFAALPDSIRDFLLEVSVLETFDPASADAVRGRMDSAQLLHRMQRHSVFLSPARDGAAWRLHPLVREFLAEALAERRGDAAVQMLHVRAADYYASIKDSTTATAHAFASQDDALIARAVAEGARAGIFQLAARPDVFDRALRTLKKGEPEPALHLMPGLAFEHCRRSDLDGARAIIDAAHRRLEEAPGPEACAAAEILEADLAIAEAALAALTDRADVAPLIDTLSRLTRTRAASTPIYRGLLVGLAALLKARRGDLEHAEDAWGEALAALADASAPWQIARAHAHQGMLAIDRGAIGRARGCRDQVFGVTAQGGDADETLSTTAAVLAARLAYLEGRDPQSLRAAHERLTRELPVLHRRADVASETLSTAYQTLAALDYPDSGLSAALDRLAAGAALVRERGLPHAARGFIGMRLHRASVDGDEAEADAAAAALDVDPAALLTEGLAFGWRHDVEVLVGAIRRDIAFGHAAKAADDAERLERIGQGLGAGRVALKAAVLRALALFACGRTADATAALGRALPALADGYAALVLEEGALAEDALDATTRHYGQFGRTVETVALAPMAADLLAMAHAYRPAAATAPPPPRPSARALEALARTALMESPAAIAAALGRSESAIQYHLRMVRAAFDVPSTWQAIAVAKRCGYLSFDIRSTDALARAGGDAPDG